MRKRPLIVVDWEDISADSGWHREDDLDDCFPHSCRSVGWKMKSEKGILRIASTRCEYTNKCADIVVIPKKNVKSIRRLE